MCGRPPERWPAAPNIVAGVEDHRHDPQFLSNLDPYQDATWALWSLRSGGYHVTVSSDREKELSAVSVAWLNRWGVQYDAVDIGDGRKLALAEAATPDDPVVFFDDNPARADDLPRPGVTVYLLDRPWNQEVKASDRVIKVRTWPELLAYFPALGSLIPTTSVLTVGAQPVVAKEQARDPDTGRFAGGEGKQPGAGRPVAGDHVRVRQWGDGKWRIQHRDDNRKVHDQVFVNPRAAIQAAHDNGWHARLPQAGRNVVVMGGHQIPADPAPKPAAGAQGLGPGRPMGLAQAPRPVGMDVAQIREHLNREDVAPGHIERALVRGDINQAQADALRDLHDNPALRAQW